jgi:hypothetical protein
MWHCVVLVWKDVSEEHMASIFRVEGLQLPAHATSLHTNFFYPDDGGDTLLRNVGSHKNYMAPHPRRRHSSWYLQLTYKIEYF